MRYGRVPNSDLFICHSTPRSNFHYALHDHIFIWNLFTCEFLNYGFHGTSTAILLASSVLCFALSHIESWCIFRGYIQTRGSSSSCSPTHKPNIFLKTATIPTYYSICIAIPRYIVMQHPSYITWLVVIHYLFIALRVSINLVCGFTHVTLEHYITCYTGRGTVVICILMAHSY